MSEVKKPSEKPSRLKVKKAEVAPTAADLKEDAVMQLCAPWVLKVDGLAEGIPLTGMKLPTFTTGMVSRGDVTIEFMNSPEMALNVMFRSWLMSPSARSLEVNTFDAEGRAIETWHMQAVPIAMGFSEFSILSDEPWVTQVAFSVSDMKITPNLKV